MALAGRCSLVYTTKHYLTGLVHSTAFLPRSAVETVVIQSGDWISWTQSGSQNPSLGYQHV